MPIPRLVQSLSAAGLIALAGWLMIGSVAVPAASSVTTGELVADPAELDFGEVQEGTHIRYFTLSNMDTTNTILLQHVVKTGACDDIIVPGSIGPSESVRIPAGWNVTGRSGSVWTDLVIVWAKKADPKV